MHGPVFESMLASVITDKRMCNCAFLCLCASIVLVGCVWEFHFTMNIEVALISCLSLFRRGRSHLKELLDIS